MRIVRVTSSFGDTTSECVWVSAQEKDGVAVGRSENGKLSPSRWLIFGDNDWDAFLVSVRDGHFDSERLNALPHGATFGIHRRLRVSRTATNLVEVFNAERPKGMRLRFSIAAWDAFLLGIKSGEFDRHELKQRWRQ